MVVAALGISQTLAWGSSYYLPAILSGSIGAGTGVSREWVFGAFSAALLIAAFAGPAVGRLIDRRGGRGVLVLSNVVLAIGLVALAAANGAVALFAAWAVLGVGMALGLYDAAFAALTALYRHNARGPITGITLFAGFASTVSWPLSTVLNDAVGWRETLLVWAALNVVVALPLNLLLPVPVRSSAQRSRRADHAGLRDMAVFDAVVNNADRKIGHLLPVADGHLYGCDHGVCFAEDYKLRTVLWQWRGKTLPRRSLEALRRLNTQLNEGDLEAELSSLLAASEIAATKIRVETLLEHRVHPYPPADWPAVPWPPV